MPDTKKLSLIVFSGDFYKTIAAFTLASGALAVGWEVNLFFTFWGLNSIKLKQGRAFTGKAVLDRFFNFLMGGRRNLPLSRLNFGGVSPRLMTGMMRRNNVATLEELVEATKALGGNFYACEMAMNILGVKKEDLIPEIRKVLGVSTFLELARGGEVLFL